jgi:3-deoxy-manno-octulosonate cytidylyltransferase (CMP-KDO synthetase)
MTIKVLGVIPSRYAATRFPGKGLADIHGKPMIWHVHRQATKAKLLDAIVIATEDARIEKACQELGLDVVMTGDRHATGTDRVAEVTTKINAQIYVNIQGDEPMIDPRAIDSVAEAIIAASPATMASNGFNEIADPTNAVDTNVVKVVMALDGAALAYSRSPIPFPKGGPAIFHRQLGLYAFRKTALRRFAALKAGPLEEAENIEMLRFLEHGYRIQMARGPNEESVSVDTKADLDRVRTLMQPPRVSVRKARTTARNPPRTPRR